MAFTCLQQGERHLKIISENKFGQYEYNLVLVPKRLMVSVQVGSFMFNLWLRNNAVNMSLGTDDFPKYGSKAKNIASHRVHFRAKDVKAYHNDERYFLNTMGSFALILYNLRQ